MNRPLLFIDYSWSRPNLVQAKREGVSGILRYLSNQPSKNLSAGELKEATRLGLAVGVVWETTASRALAGYDGGVVDAREAKRQRNNLGLTTPIYFAVDWDATPAQQDKINAYLRGAVSVLGHDKVGVYGSYWVVRRCAEAKVCKFLWQTYAWSGGHVWPNCHIFQYRNGVSMAGGQVDLDHAARDSGVFWPKMTQPASGDRTVRIAQQQLRTIGWPITVDGVKGPKTTEAIKDFQRGWAGPMKMLQHGKLGIHTKRALKWSSEHGGLTSKGGHFSYAEWKSKGNGWIKVERSLVRGLERYRKTAGPCAIVSGHRDKAHNEKVGGASNSQHVYGNAADLYPKLSTSRVKAMGAFSGIGYQGDTGLVRHVDVRHCGPSNTTGGTTKNPTIWRY